MTTKTTRLNRYLIMITLSVLLGLARYFIYDDTDFSLFSLVDKNKKEIEIDIKHSETVKKNLDFFSELNSNKEFKDEIEAFSNITSKKQISFDDAFFLHSNDLAIFIDARDQDEIAKEGQIPDSQNIPVSNIKLIYEGIRNDYNECTDYDAYNWKRRKTRKNPKNALKFKGGHRFYLRRRYCCGRRLKECKNWRHLIRLITAYSIRINDFS